MGEGRERGQREILHDLDTWTMKWQVIASERLPSFAKEKSEKGFTLLVCLNSPIEKKTQTNLK